MKLAEALAQRRDLDTKIRELTSRAQNAALKPRGGSADEDVGKLMAEIDQARSDLTDLIVRINEANIKHGIMRRTIQREGLQQLAEIYRAQAQASRVPRTRSMFEGANEPLEPALPLAELQARADSLKEQARALDLEIQALDWQIEL